MFVHLVINRIAIIPWIQQVVDSGVNRKIVYDNEQYMFAKQLTQFSSNKNAFVANMFEINRIILAVGFDQK